MIIEIHFTLIIENYILFSFSYQYFYVYLYSFECSIFRWYIYILWKIPQKFANHEMSFLRSIFNYWSKRIYRKIYFNTLSNITDHVSNNFIWIWQNKIFTKLAWNINLKIKQTLDQSILLIHKQLFTIIIQIINQSIIHIIPNIILTKIKKIPPPILRLSSND